MAKVVAPVLGTAIGFVVGGPAGAVAGAGMGLQVGGGIAAGQAASRAGQANASADLEMAAIQERLQREGDQRVIAAAMARIGASGVTYAGSPLDVQRASMAAAEQNALAIRREGQLKAEADRRAGRDAARSAYYGAAATGLQGLAQFGPGVVGRLRRGSSGSASQLGDYPTPSVDLG